MKLRIALDVSLSSQRGFSLLEVLVAVALTIGVILATTAAVANSLHGSAVAELHMSLNDDALNALVDTRAISAYDKTMLANLNGRSATMTRPAVNGGVETISVTIAPVNPVAPPVATVSPIVAPPLLATATVSEGGVTVTQSQTLFWEAPAPGSSVNQQ